MFSYYRKHIKDLAKIANPITFNKGGQKENRLER